MRGGVVIVVGWALEYWFWGGWLRRVRLLLVVGWRGWLRGAGSCTRLRGPLLL